MVAKGNVTGARSQSKESRDLKAKTSGIYSQRKDILSQMRNPKGQYQSSDSKFLEENANLKKKMEKLGEKIREFENKDVAKFATTLTTGSSPKVKSFFSLRCCKG